MSLKLYMHPLSSYCHKALMAFYENDIPFEAKSVGDPETASELKLMWPLMRFPVLRDEARDRMVPESSIIIEYLDLHYPGKVALIPTDPDRARQVRMRDRFLDNYLHTPMQKIATDRIRPAEHRDPYGVQEAHAMYKTALDMLERELSGKVWIMAEEFTMADCAAGPPLFYGKHYFGLFNSTHPNASAYLERLVARPSYARVLKEAEPYLQLVPK